MKDQLDVTSKFKHTTNWEQDDRCGNSSTQSQAPDDGYIHSRIYARATGARAQGGILKKNRDWNMVCGKKRLSTREKFKGDLYWKQCWYHSATEFSHRFCLHITEYKQIGGGAQNFLGPRGVKYLNTGLDILMSETCWAHKKWNKIASDIKLVFHSSTILRLLYPKL